MEVTSKCMVEAWSEDSDSGVDGGSACSSTADECPVVSATGGAYCDVRPRRAPPQPPSFYRAIDANHLALFMEEQRRLEAQLEAQLAIKGYICDWKGRGAPTRCARKATVDRIDKVLTGVDAWGSENLVEFNIGKTKACAFSTKSESNMGGQDEESTCGERLAVLSYEQVRRLSDVMDEEVAIHGRGNFPTLRVRLRDLVAGVRAQLEEAAVVVRDVRLNGGAASHVLSVEDQPYSDIDLIFAVDLPTARHCDRVKAAVLSSLHSLMPSGRRRPTACGLKEAYVSKMVKVIADGDRWSLISLGSSRAHRSVELKFVDSMRRQFEFSVDSFQIALDSLLVFHECAQLPIGENFYPTVVGESVYGDFQEALYHLHKKLISTRRPEEIRGGGLLKYCALLAKGYRAASPDRIKTLERYMCSRFFIDFPDLEQQRAKLEAYLRNHFIGREEEALKYRFLSLLHGVVRESTVCLMGHERRQSLALIESLAYRELCAERARQVAAAPQPLLLAHGYYYAPVAAACCGCPQGACAPPPPPACSPCSACAQCAACQPCAPCACQTCSWLACST